MSETPANVLLVVAKRPEPGRTKTRLHGEFSPAEAAEIYRCLMMDTFRLMTQVPEVKPVVAYTPDDARDYFRQIAPAHFELHPQRGPHLGDRLPNALEHYLAQPGVQRSVIMNSDGPTLPVACLVEAFTALATNEVVLGPDRDGGYYLIGMSRLHRGLFADVTWSTERVMDETLANARRLGLRVHVLPTWYDVDFGEDLKHLLAEGPLAAPQTYAYVSALRPQWLNGYG